MQATQVSVEATEASVERFETEAQEHLQAVRELSALELSLVGGGTIAVAFS